MNLTVDSSSYTPEFNTAMVSEDGEQELSFSDLKSVDYFSIDLNNSGGEMSTCSSVSLPSVLEVGNKRIFYGRQLMGEAMSDEEYDVIYEEIELDTPSRIEPSSRFEPVYSSSDDEISFETYEEELTYYTFVSTIGGSHRVSLNSNSAHRSELSTSLRRATSSAHHQQPPSLDLSTSNRRTSVVQFNSGDLKNSSHSRSSLRRSFRSSNHSRRSNSRGRRRSLINKKPMEVASPGTPLARKRRMGQRKSAPSSAFRMGLLREQMNEISNLASQNSDDDDDDDLDQEENGYDQAVEHLVEEEEEEKDVFTFKPMDLSNHRPFGPSAHTLLQQRKAGSYRDLPGVSDHTTDAIVHTMNHGEEDVSSADPSFGEASSDDGFSFYDEETIEISLDDDDDLMVSLKSTESKQDHQLPNTMAASSPSLTARKSETTVETSDYGTSEDDCGGDDDDDATQSLTESVDDVFPMQEIISPTPPPQDIPLEVSPMIDLSTHKYATRRRSDVSNKLKHLEEQMNAHLRCSQSTVTTAPMNSFSSFHNSSFCTSETSGRNSRTLMRDSTSSFFRHTNSNSPSKMLLRQTSRNSLLMEKRQQAEDKRKQLRLAFDAAVANSPIGGFYGRTRRSRSHSPQSSRHSRSIHIDDEDEIDTRMHTPVL